MIPSARKIRFAVVFIIFSFQADYCSHFVILYLSYMIQNIVLFPYRDFSFKQPICNYFHDATQICMKYSLNKINVYSITCKALLFTRSWSILYSYSNYPNVNSSELRFLQSPGYCIEQQVRRLWLSAGMDDFIQQTLLK